MKKKIFDWLFIFYKIFVTNFRGFLSERKYANLGCLFLKRFGFLHEIWLCEETCQEKATIVTPTGTKIVTLLKRKGKRN